MLHVTNGDAFGDTLRRAAPEGIVLPWRDVLHDGPVPAGLGPEELRAVRARFGAGRGWGAVADVLRDFAERDATFDDCRSHEEVVLWFEHDLYDQLQLIQVLDRLGSMTGPPTLSIVFVGEHLGPMPPERVAGLFADRKPVTPSALALGARAWSAFRAPDPSALLALLEQDCSPLPYLEDALRRLLEEYPDSASGLARSERQALEPFAGRPATLAQAFRHSGEREQAAYLGDASFASYLEVLSRAAHPALTLESGEPIIAPEVEAEGASFWRQRAILTETGKALLARTADWAALNGLDRWVGGVRLQGVPAWRWDPAARRLVESA